MLFYPGQGLTPDSSDESSAFDSTQDWSIFKTTFLLSDSVSLYDDNDIFNQAEMDYNPPKMDFEPPPKPVKQEPRSEVCPAENQMYCEWQSKYIDQWTPHDCLYWLIYEMHELKMWRNLPQVHLERFAHIDGYTLKQMSLEDFTRMFPSHGHELYNRLQRFKNPFMYSSFYSLEQWNNTSPRTDEHYYRYPVAAQEPHTLTDLDSDHMPSYPTTVVEPPYSSCSSSDGDSGFKSDSSSESIMEQPAPPEKRRPGRPRGTRRKKKPEKLGRLWEFIRDLLLNPDYNPNLICWENYEEGTFRFVHSDRVAKLWGSKKDNVDMNYEKLSRAMRYYYKSKVLMPVYGKRLVYKFGPTATGWRSERPIFRQG